MSDLTIKGKLDRQTGKPATIYTPPEDLVDPPTPKVLAKPWLSGYCNPSNDADSHDRCLGAYDSRPCKCPHHLVERLMSHAHGIRVSADAVLTFPLEDIGWEDAVRVAAELKAAREAVSAAEEFLAKHAAQEWPSVWRDEQHIEGVGSAQPYRTKSRVKWDHDGLVKAVVQHHVETAGGEVPDPLEAVRWISDAAQFAYWRVKHLGELGIEVDDYRSSERGNVRLRITSDDMVGGTTREEQP
jgi:hypothetical protein